ncbi:MAG: hypothetical protein P1P82_05465 [Bacteroidales bacterium]|nr:hypothetical protein [Bacteroidales bacterium]MDT8431418.1 hypothetical protein [Bacteroidales bacterium]
MKKRVVFLIFLVAFLPLSGQPGGVSFVLEVPEEVTAGEDFEVELFFRKGDLKDYSRFSQVLPQGFAASNVSSPNADFTFSDQRVRIIWLKLPEEEEVRVKYVISVDERLSGKLELAGTFAYVINGERAYMSLPRPEVVNIRPNPDIDPALVVDVSEFPGMIRQSKASPVTREAFATVIRQQPVIEPNGLVYVTLLINTPEGTSFLKLEESIPGGYSFEALDASGAVVSQAASLARFVWMRPPAKSVFTIRYRLVPILEEKQQPVVIQGNLSYTEDGATKEVRPRQMDVNLGSLDRTEQLALLATGEIGPGDGISSTTGTLPGNGQQPDGVTNGSQETLPDVATSPDSGPAGAPTVKGIQVLQPAAGVVFRIQLAAVKHPVYAGTFFQESSLFRNVKVEKIEGWHKYTVGPASNYAEAVQMKDRINSQSPVTDAFIVAYRDGKRMPVEDVL